MKKLKLERLNPPLLDRNISLQIGESFDVAANLLAENPCILMRSPSRK